MKKVISAVICIILALTPILGCHSANLNLNSGNASDFIPNPKVRQTIYFWDEGNMPSETNQTERNGSYFDPPDFRPYMEFVPSAEGVPIKGAVLINPGGAFSYRSPAEGLPVAEELSKYGYQCFVVNYRVRPYTQEEAALDLGRGVRFVRKHAARYGIDPNDIAVMGFSAGGILSGELALNFNSDVNGTVLDPSYLPDDLDTICADVAAVGLMYSFYGRLSVASTDVEKFRQSNLPPTYVLYGSEEIFRGQIENQVSLLEQAGVLVESHILEGYEHGFGANGNWFEDFDRFLTQTFGVSDTTEEILTVSEPVVNGNTLHLSWESKENSSDINVLTALYQDGMLAGVHINKPEEDFILDPGKTYRLKVFVWEKSNIASLVESHTFDHIISNAGKESEPQEFLNNTLEGKEGSIHYTYYLPPNYDANKRYPMLVTLPGYSSRFQTIQTTPLTENRYAKSNAETWARQMGDLIVLSPNLTDWGEKSARQTIELIEYFLDHFSVDTDRIYAAGFSAGGETLSRVISKRPDLFAAYLHCASKWSGDYEAAAGQKLPIYISMAQRDEYYGPQTAENDYNALKTAYQNTGMSAQEIEQLIVLDLKQDSYFEGNMQGNFHGSAYLIPNDNMIINWMSSHTKQNV